MKEQLRQGLLALDQIEALYEKGQINEAIEQFVKEEPKYGKNYRYLLMKAVFLLEAGMVDEAIKLLEERYYLHQLNYDTNFNLGYFYFVKQEYENALRYFIRASYCVEETEEEKIKAAMDFVEQICTIDASLVEKIGMYSKEQELSHKRIQDLFPIRSMEYTGQEHTGRKKRQFVDDRGQAANTGNGSDKYDGYRMSESYIGGAFPKEEGVAYYTGIYDQYYEERDEVPVTYQDTGAMFKTETVAGQRCYGKEFQYQTPTTVTIPVMIAKNHQPVGAEYQEKGTDSQFVTYNHMLKDRFYYYTFSDVTKLAVYSNEPIVLGEPVVWKKKKGNPNLMMTIFIDGLSQQFIEKYGLEQLMPYTYRFFKNGMRMTNAFCNGEWTYPSLASYFTSLRTTEHGMYHSSFWNQNLWKLPTVTEVLKKEGYFCSRFDGDWRSTPVCGYAKGMAREIYQQAVRTMKVDDNVEEAIEQMEAFPQTPQYIWLGIPDLHDAPDELEMRLSTQTTVTSKEREIRKTDQTSVQKTFDPVKVARYKAQLKRVDRVLETLYHYIAEHYEKNDYVISLMSDHGQGFTEEHAAYFLDEHRTRVPMYFCGCDIPAGESDALMESIDFFPTLLKAAGLPDQLGEGQALHFNEQDGRSYVITESIHEKRLYQAVVYDKEYACFLVSKQLLENDESIDLKDAAIHLIDRKTKEDVTDIQKEKSKQYEDILLAHIYEYITKL